MADSYKFAVHVYPDATDRMSLRKHVYTGTYNLQTSGAVVVDPDNQPKVIWGPTAWRKIERIFDVAADDAETEG
ncbi:hypothetical protein CH282_26210 [Rhodococcus sp. 06-418-1B]|nr:hypothetical protein CH282_26210 [Rhodococcus sp. 06-418-1B]